MDKKAQSNKFPRGFLDFLAPDSDFDNAILSIEDFGRDLDELDLPAGTILFAGIPVRFVSSSIEFDVHLGEREADPYTITKWAGSIMKIISLALCIYFIDGRREWTGFSLNILRAGRRTVKYKVSHADVQRVLYELDPEDGSGLTAEYRWEDDFLEEEVLLLNWFDKPTLPDNTQGIPSNPNRWRRYQSMGPSSVETIEEAKNQAGKDAINREREDAVFSAVVISLALAGFLSRKKCETCDAIGWPIIWSRQGQRPLSLRFCPTCERRYKREQKRQN
jgi:hypothetical protein